MGEKRSNRRHIAEHDDLVALGLGQYSHQLLHGYDDETSLTCEKSKECVPVQPISKYVAIDHTSTSPDNAAHHNLHTKNASSFKLKITYSK